MCALHRHPTCSCICVRIEKKLCLIGENRCANATTQIFSIHALPDAPLVWDLSEWKFKFRVYVMFVVNGLPFAWFALFLIHLLWPRLSLQLQRLVNRICTGKLLQPQHGAQRENSARQKRRACDGEFSLFPSCMSSRSLVYCALQCYLDRGSVGAHRTLLYGTTLRGKLSSSWFFPFFVILATTHPCCCARRRRRSRRRKCPEIVKKQRNENKEMRLERCRQLDDCKWNKRVSLSYATG